MAQNEPGAENRKLFVGGLHISTTSESLKSFYTQFGQVTDAIVMTNPQNGKSKCFGFVTFGDPAHVDNAQANRPHVVDGKQVDPKRAIPKDDPNPESRVASKKIFVGGLKREITQQDLEDYFSGFGQVAECLLVIDKQTGHSKGFAFVTFEDSDVVDKVIIARPHSVKDSRADVKKALSKEELASLRAKSASYPPQQQGGYGGYQHPGAGGDMGGYGGGGFGQGYGAPQQQMWGMQAAYQTPYGGGGGYGGGGYGSYQQGGAPYCNAGSGWGDQSGGGQWGANGNAAYQAYPQQGGYGMQQGGGAIKPGMSNPVQRSAPYPNARK